MDLSNGSAINLTEKEFAKAYRERAKSVSFNKRLPTLGAIAYFGDATNEKNEPALVGFIGGNPAIEWGRPE